jgi:uncharacterized YigZ family protein
MNRYKTAFKEAVAEQVIEKSKFIAYVKPVETKLEAERYIAGIRSLNKEANHNVPAMVIGEKCELIWASDDGEPQGTAGAPIAQMIVKEGVTNVAIVVSRYFGGIKLGTGGLVRAYTGSAKLGLSAAGICQVKDITVLSVKVDYTHLNKIQSVSSDEKFDINEIVYEDMVTIKIAAEPENINRVKRILADISSGSAFIISESMELAKILQ